MDNEKDSRVVTFRCPQTLVSALETVAAKEMCSLSYLARLAVLKDLRQRGLLPEREAV